MASDMTKFVVKSLSIVIELTRFNYPQNFNMTVPARQLRGTYHNGGRILRIRNRRVRPMMPPVPPAPHIPPITLAPIENTDFSNFLFFGGPFN
ncbi:14419_t:CDS:2 [Gigaspora rosea]|nr:14419_t:CDS:2 [Gigaspora rosea]